MDIRGWLFPNGEFLQCDLYEHIISIHDNQYVMEKVPEILKIKENLDSIKEECEEMSRREGSGNAEWHCYEIAYDRAPSQIRKLLLDNGFIRVGEANGTLHFEGRPNILKKEHQRCKDFADSYAADIIFEPQK